MQTQSYYRIADGTDCDLRVEDCPLAVNCTGVYVNREPFASSRRIRRDIYLMYLARGELEVAQGMPQVTSGRGKCSFTRRTGPFPTGRRPRGT